MVEPINVLSLFDGISCGRVALERAGIPVNKYYACEIDKYAIQISHKNYPDIIQLGSVTDIDWTDDKFKDIDLILAGSPCQGFSRAGAGLNFSDPRSQLFFDFVEALEIIKPKYFLLENVKMKQEWSDIISSYVGCEPVEINSALVSAQNRRRLYWSNLPVTQPEDKGIYLKDIVLEDALPVAIHNIYGGFSEDTVRVFTDKSPTIRTPSGGGNIPSFVLDKALPMTFTESRTDGAKEIRRRVRKETGKDFSPRRDKVVVPRVDGKANCVTATVGIENMVLSANELAYMNREVTDGRNHWDFRHHSDIKDGKSATIVANFFRGVPYNVFKSYNCIRKFQPIECERLQTLPTWRIKLEVKICIESAKNYVNVVEKSHKLLKLVGSVEQSELVEFVNFVKKNMNANHQSTKLTVQKNADTQMLNQTNLCIVNNLEERCAYADNAENCSKLSTQNKENSVRWNVFINTTQEKILNNGSEELHQREKNCVVQESGRRLLSLSGNEIMQLAEDVEQNLITKLGNNSIYTTLNRLGLENLEQMLIIYYWYAKSVIDGYIVVETQIKSLLFDVLVPYTEGISNTQRYKCIGNGWTVSVISHILRGIE